VPIVVGMPNAPSLEHEALHRIFLRRRGLLPRVLPGFEELDPQDPQKLRELSIDYNAPPEVLVRHGDSALLTEFLIDNQGQKCAVLVEAQTSADPETAFRWPYYATFVRTKYRCPVALVVVTIDAAVARKARQPIEIGPSSCPWMAGSPRVFGPDTEPVITDLATAEKDIDTAIFSALIHGRSSRIGAILEVLAMALASVDPATASDLVDFIEGGLGDTPGREHWRKLMKTSTFPYVSELRAEAMAEGRARDIEQLLDKRGIAMGAADRERILECRDGQTLDTWLDRVLGVSAIGELFAD
jgi:hypothetical protein